jgi:RNA polymerase sigma factor (sigma-70 family)
MSVDQDKDDSYEEQLELIRDYVATLPKSMQELFNLIYIEELSQAEVCARLGVSKSTVSERKKTLENKIKKHFSKKPELFGKNAD